MRSIRSTKTIFFLLLLSISFHMSAQENSPYSRYGLGDVYPAANISGRAMGGLSTAVGDYNPIPRSKVDGTPVFFTDRVINFSNPASYSRLKVITYDLGISVDDRKLKSGTPAASYNSTNFIPSYVAIGIPINKNKNFSMAVGLRPVTRINYNITTAGRIATIDSIETVYEGSGGLNQFFLGASKRWGDFSVGINAAYNFGRRELITRTEFINDTVLYYKGQHSTTTYFSGLGVEGGLLYESTLKQKKDVKNNLVSSYLLRLGVTAALKQNLKAKQDIDRQTYVYDGAGGTFKIDSVYSLNDLPGTVVLPAKYSIGAAIEKRSFNPDGGAAWSAGIQYDLQQWGSQYKFMGQTDRVINSNMFRIGGEITPNHWSSSIFNRMTYRLGFFTGKDYINADNNNLKVTGFTAGFAIPMYNFRSSQQFTMINAAVEIGKRGSAVNNISENFARFSLALSLTDIWFRKPKYD